MTDFLYPDAPPPPFASPPSHDHRTCNKNAEKQIYHHFTCATDTTNIQHVFDAVRWVLAPATLTLTLLCHPSLALPSPSPFPPLTPPSSRRLEHFVRLGVIYPRILFVCTCTLQRHHYRKEPRINRPAMRSPSHLAPYLPPSCPMQRTQFHNHQKAKPQRRDRDVNTYNAFNFRNTYIWPGLEIGWCI